MRLVDFRKHAIFNEDMIYAGWMVKKGYGVAYVSEARVYILTIIPVCSSSTGILSGSFPGEHPEVFEGVPSEGEGIRLVKKAWHIF